ncbi:MAG: glycosyltransferase [Candidatus Omnitrophota bacterium]|nr:glycosyltransferase [Candidatus Omnitrophota bacterium]
MLTPKIVYAVFVACLGYFLFLTIYYAFLALIGSYEGRKRSLQGEEEDYSLVYFSNFNIPVSFIVPARNEEEWIAESIKSLLNLNYPKFEIIVVNDGSTDKTMDILDSLLKLRPSDIMYIKHYKDGMLRRILKSELHPNITVIDKEAGTKKAGAANAGLNIAKYNHVCVVDADTIFEPDAILRIMAHVAKDPDKIIGIGSYFGLLNGFKIKEGRIMEHSPTYNPIVASQNVEYIRSFMGNRLAWSRFNAMPNVAGGFGVWRKDVLYELGGYSVDFTCEDIEFTFRAHDYVVKHKDKGYRILMMPYCVGWTEGPANVTSLISQRERWQRVTDETVWRYKYMMFNPRFGGFGFLVFPYFVLYEVLGVFVEVVSVAFVAAGWAAGVLQWNVFLAFFSFMLLSQAFTSLLAILTFTEEQRLFRLRYIMYLVILTFTEFFWYRWIISIAKLVGTFRFLFRIKSFDRYVRSKHV